MQVKGKCAFLTLKHFSMFSLGRQPRAVSTWFPTKPGGSRNRAAWLAQEAPERKISRDATLWFLGFLHSVQRIPAMKAVGRMEGPIFRRQY